MQKYIIIRLLFNKYTGITRINSNNNNAVKIIYKLMLKR